MSCKMWRFASLFLLLVATAPLVSAQAPLSTLCPQMTDNAIDDSLKSCRSTEVVLTGPRDFKLYNFNYYGDNPDVGVRFTVRAVVGSVLATFTSGGAVFSISTFEGPAMLRLDPTSGDEDNWSLRVESLLGLPSKFIIEITTSNTSTRATLATRRLLDSMFAQCCDSTPDSNNPIIRGKAVPTPCRLLGQWTTSTNASTDVCQSNFAHCTPQGTLDVLILRSYVIPGPEDTYDILTAFNEECTDSPPTALSSLTDLTHLEMFSMGLQWTVSDLVTALTPLSKLERLYLGYNQINGELDEDACKLFVGTPLKSLSFRNPIEYEIPYDNDSPPWNAISGDLHPCIFNSSLENLNLVMNQITSIPSIPDSKSITGLLKNLRMYQQVDPSNDYIATMKGAGVPKGLENLKQLELLGLGGNELGGSLEDVILPPNLEWLDLSENNLEGQIPDLTKQYSKLSTLIISYNPGLKQDITKMGLSGLSELLYLDISNTSIYGAPSQVDWSKLSNLKVLDASGTQMEGEIPVSLAKLPELQELVLSENPKITSQTAFAEALPEDNNITVYDVHSCNLIDLPDGLRKLKFFGAQYINIYKTNAWVFDITNNDIEAPLPAWLVAPLQQPLNLFQTLANSREIFSNGPPQYVFAIQLNVADEPEGNKLGCPNEPVAAEALQYAVELQYIYKAQYNNWVNCFNGSEAVPVASYLSWLNTVGPLPAPPPYTASRNRAIATQSRSSSEGGKKGPSAGVLAGIVVGVLVGVAILAAAAFVIVKVVMPKMKKKSFEKFQDTDPQGIQTGPYGSPDQFQMAVQAPVPPQGPNAV